MGRWLFYIHDRCSGTSNFLFPLMTNTWGYIAHAKCLMMVGKVVIVIRDVEKKG